MHPQEVILCQVEDLVPCLSLNVLPSCTRGFRNGTSAENPKPKPCGSKDPAKKPHVPLQIPNCIWQKPPVKTSDWGHEVRKSS